ncbi:ATP-binding protein [Embleya sp. NPDC005575]|uniref:ATP-binding protein n=1 Tax=Embleya sp. NPDC005575 TaxID=3156892 RepID=UPI0033A31A73
MSVVLLESEDVAWFRDNLTGARGAASRLAERIGMNQHRAGEVALAMSEAASNLVKHAVAGAIVLRIVRTGQHAGIEFLDLDEGPGMADVGAAMRDGRSTTGTLGIGLGMVARLADTFDPHSAPGHGTVVLARFWPRDTPLRHPGAYGDPPESVVAGVTRPISAARTARTADRRAGTAGRHAGTTPGHRRPGPPRAIRRQAPVSPPGPDRAGDRSPHDRPRVPPPARGGRFW